MSQIIQAAPDLRHLADDDEDQPLRQQKTDALIAAQRAQTPQSVIDKRKTPRLSIAELNSMDTDQLIEKFKKIRADDRTPIEQVMDIIDLPRNTVANIAVGQPSAGGVASTILGPAAIGAGIGAIAGPFGAGAGALGGAAIGAAADTAAFIARQFTGDETKAEIAKETEGAGTGAFEQPRIHSGDVLRALGVKNRVIAGIGGFVGDMAFDPLTYVGAPGWGTTLKSGVATGRAATLIPGAKKAIEAGIAEAAAGKAESTIGKYLAAKGITKGAEESAINFADRAGSAIYGKRAPLRSASGLLDRAFATIGGNKNIIGGGLIDDAFTPVIDQATIHARDFIKEFQQGAGKALRIGVPEGEIGSAILHIPFTQYGVQVPAFTEHARRASNFATQIATLKDIGLGEAALRNATASTTYQNVLELGRLQDELHEMNLREVSARGQIEALRKAMPAGTETGAMPTAGGRVADVLGEVVDKTTGEVKPAFALRSGEPGGVPLREGPGPVPTVDGLTGLGEAKGGAAGQQTMFTVTGKPIDQGPDVVQSPHRTRVVAEMKDAFGPEAEAIAPVIDAYAKGWAKSQGKTVDDYYAGLKAVKGGTPGQGALYSIMAHHGSPHRFDKFDIGKIGIGEGAQAYGHGLYFTSSEDVAKWYRDNLAQSRISLRHPNGEELDMIALAKDPVAREAYATLKYWKGNYDTAIASLEAPSFSSSAPLQTRAARLLDKWKTSGIKAEFVNDGHLYKVELAPEEHQLLDWDKPMSQQSEHVQNAVTSKLSIVKDTEPSDSKWLLKFGDRTVSGFDTKKEAAAFVNERPAAEFYRAFDATIGPKNTSKMLREAGVPGIRYIGDSSGTKNYVIFHHDDVAIKEMLQRGEKGIAQGSYELGQSGQRVIRALTDPNASTLPHEIAHDFLTNLPQMDPALAEDAAKSLGAESHAAMTVEHQEQFARGFEAYLREGHAPSAGLQAAFEKFKNWLIDIYKSIVGTPLENQLNPQLRSIFDRMLTHGDEMAHRQLTEQARVVRMEAATRRKEIIEKMDFLLRSSERAFDSLDPEDAVKSLNGVQDYLAQAEAVRLAEVQRDSALATKNLFEELSKRGLAEMGFDDLAEQLKDGELARILIEDPDSLERLSTAAGVRLEAANKNWQAMKAPLDQALNEQDKAFVSFIKSQMGIDNDAMALSWAGRMGNSIKYKYGKENALTRKLDSIDRFMRNTFGPRGGEVRRDLVHMRAMATKSGERARLIRSELEASVQKAIKSAGLDSKADDLLPQSMRYIHLRASEMANRGQPDFRFYNWAFDPNGPKIGKDGLIQNPASLLEAVREMKSSGMLANAKLIEALDAEAKRIEPLYAAALDSARAEGIKHLGIPGYTGPNVLTPEAEKLIDRQFQRTGQNPTKGPLTNRTMSVVRYVDPRGEFAGKWREFHVSDTHLIETYPDLPPEVLKARREAKKWQYPIGQEEGGPLPHADIYEKTPEEAIREKYSANPGVGERKIAARDAAKRFRDLKRDDPAFAAKAEKEYYPRIVDPVELNKLANEGYFDDMTGGIRTPEGIFDTDAGAVLESYFGSAQRIASQKAILDHIYKNSLRFNPEVLTGEAGKNGMPFTMKNGVKARILSQPTNFGGDSFGVQIGNQKYRSLDPKFYGTIGEKMLNLHGEDVRGLMLPSEQADFIENVGKALDENTFTRMLKGLDQTTGLWKMLTLLHPSWMINDAIGNTVLALSGGAKVEHLFNPTDTRQMIQLVHRGLKDREFAESVVFHLPQGKVNGAELLELMDQTGIAHNTLALETMARYIDKEPGILSSTHRMMSGYLGPWFRMNQKVNDVQRGMAFLSHLKQGNTVNEAAFKTLNSMFDFGDMTNVERTVFRRLIPFMSWIRNNAGYQMNLLLRRPSWAAMAPKARTALEESIAGEAAVPQEQRPSWMREALAAQVGSDPESRFGLLIGQGALPTTDIYNYLAPLAGVSGALKFLNYFVSNLNPAITTPLQLGTGVDFFSRRTIGADIGADMSPSDAIIGQLRPVSEYGPGGKVAQALDRSVFEGVGRALIGGRIQAMDEDRLSSTVEREANDKAMKIRAAVNRAERLKDKKGSLEARAALLSHYQVMQERGLRIPKWAAEEIAAAGAAR